MRVELGFDRLLRVCKVSPVLPKYNIYNFLRAILVIIERMALFIYSILRNYKGNNRHYYEQENA